MRTRTTIRPHLLALAAVILPVTLAFLGTPTIAAGNPSVTGGGQYFGPFGHVVVSVSAVHHSDGTVSGHFHQYNLDNGHITDGTVNCLYFFTGNTAVVTGVLTKTQNFPAGSEVQPGDSFGIVVVDNGEGAGASPDEVTPFGYDLPGTVIDCSDAEFYQFQGRLLTPLSAGNFQVSP